MRDRCQTRSCSFPASPDPSGYFVHPLPLSQGFPVRSFEGWRPTLAGGWFPPPSVSSSHGHTGSFSDILTIESPCRGPCPRASPFPSYGVSGSACAWLHLAGSPSHAALLLCSSPLLTRQTQQCDYRNDVRQGTIRNYTDKSEQTA